MSKPLEPHYIAFLALSFVITLIWLIYVNTGWLKRTRAQVEFDKRYGRGRSPMSGYRVEVGAFFASFWLLFVPLMFLDHFGLLNLGKWSPTVIAVLAFASFLMGTHSLMRRFQFRFSKDFDPEETALLPGDRSVDNRLPRLPLRRAIRAIIDGGIKPPAQQPIEAESSPDAVPPAALPDGDKPRNSAPQATGPAVEIIPTRFDRL